MATITDFVKGKVAFFDLGGKKHYAENTIDFSKAPAVANDIVQAVKIPWGAFVTDVVVIVHTSQGAAVTVDVGDDIDDNGYDTSVDLNAVGVTKVDAAVYINGVHYVRQGADKSKFTTINLKANGTLDTAVVTVLVEYARLESVSNGVS